MRPIRDLGVSYMKVEAIWNDFQVLLLPARKVSCQTAILSQKYQVYNGKTQFDEHVT